MIFKHCGCFRHISRGENLQNKSLEKISSAIFAWVKTKSREIGSGTKMWA